MRPMISRRPSSQGMGVLPSCTRASLLDTRSLGSVSTSTCFRACINVSCPVLLVLTGLLHHLLLTHPLLAVTGGLASTLQA